MRLQKPLPIIQSDKIKEFVRRGNEKKATPEFLEQCKKTASLFVRR